MGKKWPTTVVVGLVERLRREISPAMKTPHLLGVCANRSVVTQRNSAHPEGERCWRVFPVWARCHVTGHAVFGS